MVKSCFTSLVFHPKNSTCPFSCPGRSPSTSKCTEQFLATAAKWSAKVVRRLNSLFESNSSWWYGYSAPLYQHVHHLVPTQDETTWQPIKNLFVRREITTVDSWSAVGFFSVGWLIHMSCLELRTPAASVTSTAAMAFLARPASPVWLSGLHLRVFKSHVHVL